MNLQEAIARQKAMLGNQTAPVTTEETKQAPVQTTPQVATPQVATPQVATPPMGTVVAPATNALLESLNQAVVNAADAPTFEPLEDGIYEVVIENVEFKQSNSLEDGSPRDASKPQRDMFVITLDVPAMGRKEFVNLVYGGTEDWAKRNSATMITYMGRFGVDLTSTDAMIQTVDNMIGKTAAYHVTTKISKTTGKEFRNTILR